MEDKLLPSHHRLLIQLHHKGWRSVSGASSKYDDRYPIALLGLVPQSEFKLCIDALNQTAIDFFPCPTSYLCSYLFCLCTLGVMLLCGDPGITEWQENMDKVLRHINKRAFFLKSGITWQLRTSAWTSCIEVVQEESHPSGYGY